MFVSVLTEHEAEEPVQPSEIAIGADIGVARSATFSDGSAIKPMHSFRKRQKLAASQGKLAKRTKVSTGWQALKKRIQRLCRKSADVCNSFLHKTTMAISKKRVIVIVGNWKARNMSCPVSGMHKSPG